MNSSPVSLDELHNVYLFRKLEAHQLELIQKTMHHQHVTEKHLIFHHGDPADRFFLLRSGQIKLFRLSAEGAEKVIEIIRPGQTFAEAIMFMDDHTYPVSAEVLEDGELVSFDAQVLTEILHGSIDACFDLMAILCQRMHKWINEIDKLTLHNATFRLISYLLESFPPQVMASPQIHLTTPKHVIASRLSIKPETLSRILNKLAKQGLISVEGTTITLCDINGLRKLLHQPV